MKNKLSMLVLLVLPILLGFGSCSSGPRFLERIPGGVLDGEVVGSVVEDWGFVADAGLCDLETRPNFPHSIKLNCFNDGPKLYIGCMNCDGKLWSSYVASDPRGRIRIKTKIYITWYSILFFGFITEIPLAKSIALPPPTTNI